MFSAFPPLLKHRITHRAFPLYYLSTCSSEYSYQRDEPLEESVDNVSHWTKKIHYLCVKEGNVDQALRLLDSLRLRGYRPDPLNVSSIIHALCDARRFDEAHRRLILSVASDCIPDERTCNVLLARLLDSRRPDSTFRVVRRLIDAKPQFVPSLVNYNRLIDQLCCFFLPTVAHRLFFDMKSRGHIPNTVSYTSLINGYGRVGKFNDAHKLFDEMAENRVSTNSLTFSVLIHGTLRKRDVKSCRALMVQLWDKMRDEKESSTNNAAFCNLIDSLCREGFLNEVFQIAEEMPQKNSVADEFAYSQMIDSLCNAKRHHSASRIVYIMRKRGIFPGMLSYNSIVHGLTQDGSCMRAYQLLEEGIEFGYVPSEFTYKILVENLCIELEINKAKEVLQIMLKKEGLDRTRIFNIYLRALSLVSNSTELLNTLVSMLQMECQPDAITLNTILKGFCKTGKIKEAFEVLNSMINGKFSPPDAVTFTTMICGLLNVGRIEESLDFLYKIMPENGFTPEVITYNGTIRGLLKLGRTNEAMSVFDSMVRNGVSADSTTYATIIDGLSEADRIEEAKKFWEEVVWPSKIHDNFVYAAILKGLCRSQKLNEACHFLYELVDAGVCPNNFSFNIVINGACNWGSKRDAYGLVKEMRRIGLAPDAVTWRILEKLHGRMRKFCDDELEGEEEVLNGNDEELKKSKSLSSMQSCYSNPSSQGETSSAR